jgi:type II secretory pathway pseudopilin PulG
MSRRRSRRLAGFVLAEALVSAAIAALTAGLAVTLLAWSARSVSESQASLGAVRVQERVYEEARLLTPAALGMMGQGTMGRYRWLRTSGPRLDSRFEDAPVPLRITVTWTAGGRPWSRTLEALVAPGSAPPGTVVPAKAAAS